MNFYPKTCYNSMIRVLDEVELDETGLTRIANLPAYFSEGTKVLQTCGVVTNIYGAYSAETEEMVLEMHLDDGLDKAIVFAPFAVMETVNVGQVISCIIKKPIDIPKEDSPTYLGGQVSVLGAVVEMDMLVC